MPDLLFILLLVAAVLLVADRLLASRLITAAGDPTMTILDIRPLAVGALVVLVLGLPLALAAQP